jgi:hypothetical protein
MFARFHRHATKPPVIEPIPICIHLLGDALWENSNA